MKRNEQQNIQDRYLNVLRKENIPVSIIITNGYQIRNVKIVGFDSFVILVTNEDGQMMLFKHAISSIIPAKTVDLSKQPEDDE